MIMVWVETEAEGLLVTSRETLTFARGLSATGGPVEAVLVGPVAEEAWPAVLAQLGEQGVSRVHRAEGEGYTAYAAAAWAGAVVHAASASNASLVMAAGTPRGSEVMAHAATRLGAAMAANVVAVDQAAGPLLVSRQVMGGSVLEQMRLDGDVAVVTVAGHAVEPESAASPGEVEVSRLDVEPSEADLVTRVARVEETESEDTSALTKARVVVGAGRGVGSAEGFDDLLELRDLLGGSLGVSRVVTNLGWRPHHEQVGQTGSRITPDVYLACGISGAIQHWTGCQSAKTIVAVNTDEDAPMVTKADYAVIGDLHEIVPAVNEELRRRLG